jgi:hypothetical protein
VTPPGTRAGERRCAGVAGFVGNLAEVGVDRGPDVPRAERERLFAPCEQLGDFG